MNNFQGIPLQSWLVSKLLHFKTVGAARLYLKQKYQAHDIKNIVPTPPIQLLVDVSVIVQHDAGTGIQRVVRTVWKKLIECSKGNPNYVVVPIYATRKKSYRYVNVETNEKTNDMVKVNLGDVFLGLDWSAHLLTANEATLCHWKKIGVSLNFVLYDFLPLSNPEWFTTQTTDKFTRWLKTIGVYADGILCISNSVKSDITGWFKANYVTENVPRIDAFPLGGDFVEASKVEGLLNSNTSHQILDELKGKNFILTVGTLEPRKGHSELLDAFDIIWSDSKSSYIWVIVGKPGWHTELLQKRIREHMELGKRIFWIKDADDVLLHQLYVGSKGVIVPSKGEGYGLPIAEGLAYNKKMLVRDIPVFREIGGVSVDYFQTDDSIQLSKKICEWSMLTNLEQPQLYQAKTWQEASEELIRLLHIGKDYGNNFLCAKF